MTATGAAIWRERAFETLVENAADIISRVDRDLRHVYVNNAVSRAMGREPSEFIGKTNVEAGIPADVAKQLDGAVLRVFESAREEMIEFAWPLQDQRIAWFRSRIVPELTADGTVESALVVSRDITDVKAAEAVRADRERRDALAEVVAELQRTNDKLRRSEERLRRLVDGNIIGVVMANERTIFEANDAFLGIIGYSREELAAGAIQWREMTPPEYLPRDDAAIELLLKTGTCPPLEKEFLLRDGTRVSVLVGASILSTDPLEWVCFVLDVSEAKKIEAEKGELLERERQLREAAERATEAKDKLLAAVSHELRNPLTTLTAWLQILQAEPDGELRELAFHSMRDAVSSQRRLVDDLLDAVRFAHGKAPLSLEAFDLADVVDDVVGTMLPVAGECGITLSHAAESPVRVVADRARIAQVAANLLSNAVKFTQRGGSVTIRTAAAPGVAVLEVVDTGCGIDADFLPHVFEQFSQAGTHSFHGLGLGLSIVRDIVQLHGGSVTAESDGPGCGARFTVRLPVQ